MNEDTRVSRALDVAVLAMRESRGAGTSVLRALWARKGLEEVLDILSEPSPEQETPCAEITTSAMSADQVRRGAISTGSDTEEVLIWVSDKASGKYGYWKLPFGSGLTLDYREAVRMPRREGRTWVDCHAKDPGPRVLTADLEGWVPNWGEQPVPESMRLEVKVTTFPAVRMNVAVPAGCWHWQLSGVAVGITHFRPPVPEERASEEWVDEDGDPTDAALERIKKWSSKELPGLFDFIDELWDHDYGSITDSTLDGRRTLKLCTGGWTSNERILDALQDNWTAWAMTWRQSKRGGALWFDAERFGRAPG